MAPAPLRVVCDANLPYAREAFGTLGEVTLCDGRAISPDLVRTADLLITRSTTRVDRALLEGSRLRFYGSAVIGTDHVDTAWLAAAGIPWSAAPGCNAESVAEYLTAAMLLMAHRRGRRLHGRTLGVVGVGQVGRRVCAKGLALGMRVLACDPPRQRDPADVAARTFVPLAELLAASDVVTLHVPLTRGGPDATWHLLDAAALARIKPGSLLINAARGEVLDTDALLAVLGTRLDGAVCDTWEGEPNYRADLLARADLATPHVAGHSFEGKVNGTLYVYAAACRALGRTPAFQPVLPPPLVPAWNCGPVPAGGDPEDVLRPLVLAVCDIAADDRRFRATCGVEPSVRAQAFDQLRRTYPMRREFVATRVSFAGASTELRRTVADLGFATGEGL